MTTSEEDNSAYNEGLDAQNDGIGIDGNPHEPGTSLFNSWELGWQQGYDEDFDEDMSRE